MARKMDKLSEAIWFQGRADRPRQRVDWKRYRENYARIFGDKPLNIMKMDDPFRSSGR